MATAGRPASRFGAIKLARILARSYGFQWLAAELR
jgi:hypothetical protein